MLLQFTQALHHHLHLLSKTHHPHRSRLYQNLIMANKLSLDYVAFLEGLRKDNKKELQDASTRWNELANKKSAELSKHLFTIASLILPLSLIPVTNRDFFISIPLYGKWCLVFAWTSFVISLIMGIVHLTREASFFNKWAEQENERSKAYTEGIFTTSPVKAFGRLDEMGKKSASLMKMKLTPTNFFLYSQEIFLVSGIILVGIILVTKVFSC